MKDLGNLKEVTVTVHAHDVRLIPLTNADRIRSMTDEELANKLYDWFSDDCLSCPVLKSDCPVWETGDIRCYDAILEWLKQEAAE